MIFFLDTSTAECKMSLLKDGNMISCSWSAHRELADRLLKEVNIFLAAHGTDIHSLKGIVVYKGPGSFTGLRIGITVMNAFADSLKIPIIGATGEKWQQDGTTLINTGQNHLIVLPEYGSPPHITKPKKE